MRISYRRPGDFAPHEFVVEPYRLHRTASGAAAVHAWQVAPELEGRPEAWRGSVRGAVPPIGARHREQSRLGRDFTPSAVT